MRIVTDGWRMELETQTSLIEIDPNWFCKRNFKPIETPQSGSIMSHAPLIESYFILKRIAVEIREKHLQQDDARSRNIRLEEIMFTSFC